MPSPAPEQFADSLVQSFLTLWEFRQEFQKRSFTGFDDAARQLTLFWDPKFLPNFEVIDDIIKSRQEGFFTILVFAEALSEFLAGVEELGARDVLQRKDYNQFANFASYTSCFHLIDSILCLRGAYYLSNPIGDCEWRIFRRMKDPRAKRAPVLQLEPSALCFKGRKLSFLLAKWAGSTTSNTWIFETRDIRSPHASRWRCFGEELEAVLNEGGLESIPKPIRDSFGFFAGHLAYQGVEEHDSNTLQGLRRLIQFCCKDTNFEDIRRDPLVPKLRNLAIYRNRSLDEHLRLIATMLDTTIVDSPTKLIGHNFNRFAEGLAKWQADRLTSIVSRVETSLGRNSDIFSNGMRSVYLFSGLVELDFSKVVDSVCYDSLHTSIRDTIAPIFRNQTFIPVRRDFRFSNVGTSEQPKYHMLRIPITIPDVLTLRDDWFPGPEKPG